VVGTGDAPGGPVGGAGCMEHAVSATSDMLAKVRAFICIASQMPNLPPIDTTMISARLPSPAPTNALPVVFKAAGPNRFLNSGGPSGQRLGHERQILTARSAKLLASTLVRSTARTEHLVTSRTALAISA